MSFKIYQKKKQETIEILEKTMSAVESMSLKHFIDQKVNNLKQDRFVISVFGHFSNGKSKFLNTLMGFETPVLVEDELACTATITRLCAPSQKELVNQAEVIFVDGGKKIIPMADLALYSSRRKDCNVEHNIRQVSLFINSEYLQNGVEIVDTPGFNSVYSIHTDIARNYVEKSDASIFIFATDKPGSDPEFKFLNHVSHYMNRIFFVMNKIDLCDYSDNVDKLAEDLREKMVRKGIPLEGKIIYPISARWAQETIGEPNEEKRRQSRFDVFMQALNSYLTQEDNVKDRLAAPLEAVQRRLQEEREALQEKIQVLSKSEEELKREIEKKKERLEELGRTIKEKTEHIKREVRNAVSEARRSMEDVVEDRYRNIELELGNVETEFDIELFDFEGMVIGIYDKLLRGWEKVTYQLEQNLAGLIEENIDDEKQAKKISESLMRILDRALDLEQKEGDSIKVDFKELDELDRQLQMSKNDYLTMRAKLKACRGDNLHYEKLKVEKAALDRKIDRLEEQRERQFESIGDPRPIEKHRNIERTRERTGFIGKIGNFLFGPQVVNTTESYTDYSPVREANDRKREIEQDYSVKISMQEQELRGKLKELEKFGDPEGDMREVKIEVEGARQKYEAAEKKIEQEKTKRVAKILRVSKKNYLGGVRDVCDEYTTYTRNFLEDQKRLISKIMEETLREEKRQAETMQETYYNLTDLGGRTPEELQNQIKLFYDQLAVVKAYIIQLQDVKECI